MLKSICEGIDKNATLQEFAGSPLEKDSLFNMFKQLITSPEDDERYDSFFMLFEKMLQDTFEIGIDEVMDALDELEYDDDGKYIGGGEEAARLLNTTVSNLSSFMATLGEDAEVNVEKIMIEHCGKDHSKMKKSKKGEKHESTEDLDVDQISDKLAEASSFEPDADEKE